MNVSDWPGRLPDELILIIAGHSVNTKCETDYSWDISPRLTLLLVRAGPFSRAGYGKQNGAGNGPEFSFSGGCDPGTGDLGGLDSPELVHSPLESHGSKRKRGRDPAQPSRSSSVKQATRTFACPYYLHDRNRHSDCLYIRLTRLSDVRQHLLERAHYQPVHCPVCGRRFQGRLADARRQRDAHVRARTCEPSPFPFHYPGITEDGEQRIREIARNNRTNHFTEVHRWYMIWDFLFPGEPRPESPFLYDPPEIQRLVDWTGMIFGEDLWRGLPVEPWTMAMNLEQQRAGMSQFLGAFIVLARDLVMQDESLIEDHHEADDSSYMGANTPAPSVATPGISSMASSPLHVAPEASRSMYLRPPPPFTGSRPDQDTRRLGQIEPSWSDASPIGPQISYRPAHGPQASHGPALVVPRELQQPAPPQEAAVIAHDPALPSLAVVENFSDMFADAWFVFNNEDANADHNLDPTGEEEHGSHQ